MQRALSMTSYWTPQHLAGLEVHASNTVPALSSRQLDTILPDRWYWDQVPLLDANGSVADLDGREAWLALSTPVVSPPERRHERARIRLLLRSELGWTDCGNLMPDQFSAGSREWAGMAQLADDGTVSAYYTAAGAAGETAPTYRQRIFFAEASLERVGPTPRIGQWRDHREILKADGTRYLPANQSSGEPGSVRAFRDPFWFRDPANFNEYLLFVASGAQSRTAHNAIVGIASKSGDSWHLLDPVIDGDGVTHEMERPHIVFHQERYYLFWSAHGWNFGDGISAPTGLYGMVADSVQGLWHPLNGSGLVAANPPSCPYQCYSWFVTPDLRVASFVDMLDGRIDASPGSPRYPIGSYVGKFAPPFSLRIKGNTAYVDK